MLPPVPVVVGAKPTPYDPPAPLAAGGGPHDGTQVWLTASQISPGMQGGHKTLTPQTVPLPHCQSTPHRGTWQQVPVGPHTSPVAHLQSCPQLLQFSPEAEAQIKSPQTGR